MGLKKAIFAVIAAAFLFLCACSNSTETSSGSSFSTEQSNDGSTVLGVKSSNLASLDDLQDIKKFFCINEFTASEPNSAGGVDCNITFWSFGDVIKYITFWVEPYNAVDDVVFCEIKNKSEIKIKYTGPTETSDPTSIVLKNAWYNHTIKTVKINKVKIELINGAIYETEDIESLLVNGIKIKYGMYGAYQSAIKRIIRKTLDKNGTTEEEFIAGFSGYMKEMMEDILDSSSSLKYIPTSTFSSIAVSLKISMEELIYSL